MTHLDLQAFFAQEAWLLRLARRLVHDDAAAQDLVQETWLATLRCPPRDRSQPRAWLAVVAKRLAAGQRRRRRPVEDIAVRECASEVVGPDWAEIRFETGTQLRHAVESLAPKLRRVVILRFQESLSTPEIARLIGVSERTVGGRLKRALEQIRYRLDSEVEGCDLDGPCWAILLAPLLRPSDLTLGPVALPASDGGSSLSAATGSLPAGSSIGVYAGICLLLAAGAVGIQRAFHSDPVQPATPALRLSTAETPPLGSSLLDRAPVQEPLLPVDSESAERGAATSTRPSLTPGKVSAAGSGSSGPVPPVGALTGDLWINGRPAEGWGISSSLAVVGGSYRQLPPGVTPLARDGSFSLSLPEQARCLVFLNHLRSSPNDWIPQPYNQASALYSFWQEVGSDSPPPLHLRIRTGKLRILLPGAPAGPPRGTTPPGNDRGLPDCDGEGGGSREFALLYRGPQFAAEAYACALADTTEVLFVDVPMGRVQLELGGELLQECDVYAGETTVVDLRSRD